MRGFKQLLRNQFRDRRKAISLTKQNQYTERIAQQLFITPYFQQAKHIALYAEFDGEVPTHSIIEKALSLNKCCYLPMVNQGVLQFALVDAQTPLVTNTYGIREPSGTLSFIAPQMLNLVLLPLVAFDRKGHRLGMGGGYYDKTFAKKGVQPFLIGLAYDLQKINEIPHTPLDLTLDAIITEKQLYHPQGKI